MESEDWFELRTRLNNISVSLESQNRLALANQLGKLALILASAIGDKEGHFVACLKRFHSKAILGKWKEGESDWNSLSKRLKGNWSWPIYRPGTAESYYAEFKYKEGKLTEQHLETAEQLLKSSKYRRGLRRLYSMRAFWQLDNREWRVAAENCAEVLRMARESGVSSVDVDTGLALAKFFLRQLHDPEQEAKRLASFRNPAHYYLALLWQAIGDHGQAKHHALAAYRYAWADGEPYVRRYELNQTTALLNELQVPIPDLPPYDPSKDEPFPWEAEVEAAIEKLKAEKAAKEAAKEEE